MASQIWKERWLQRREAKKAKALPPTDLLFTLGMERRLTLRDRGGLVGTGRVIRHDKEVLRARVIFYRLKVKIEIQSSVNRESVQ